MSYKHSSGRIQQRRAGGQFRRTSLEQDFGLRTAVCACGGINPYGRKPIDRSQPFIDPMEFNKWERPSHCSHCGAELPTE